MNLFSGLFFHKKFTPFFWVQFLGALNDNIIKNMLVLLIAYKGISILGLPSESLIALAGAIFILPFIIFSPFAGLLADKFNKVQIMRVTKLAELVIMLLATYGFYANDFTVLLVSLFLMGIQSTFFGPVKFSIIPSIVKKENLTNANGYVEFGTFLAILIGTILGGLLSSNESWIVLGGTLCVVSILGLVASLCQPLTKEKSTVDQVKLSWNFFVGFKELYKILSQQKHILSVVLAISCFWFFGAGLLTVLPIYCKNIIHVNEEVVTLFLSMFTVGIGMGSLTCGMLTKKKVNLSIAPFGIIGVLFFVIDFYWFNRSYIASASVLDIELFLNSEGSYRLLLDFLLMSFFGGIFIVPLYAYMQEQGEAKTLSRVIAANNILNAVFMVFVSVLIMGLLSLGKSIVSILLIIVIIYFFISSLVIFTNYKLRRTIFNFNKSSE